jgi:hypothetical protein
MGRLHDSREPSTPKTTWNIPYNEIIIAATIAIAHAWLAFDAIPQYWYIIAGVSAPLHYFSMGAILWKKHQPKKERKIRIWTNKVRYGGALGIFLVFWILAAFFSVYLFFLGITGAWLWLYATMGN